MREVRSGDGIVLLDLAKDEYSCCYDPVASHRDYCALVEPARATGFDRSRAVRVPAWTEAEPWDFPRPRPGDVLRFLITLVTSGVRFYGRSVCHLAWRARALGVGNAGASLTPQQAANLFRYFISLTPLKPKCLFGSFALLHFLDWYGLGADWVFGVRLFPFRAHCWLACDGVLLNERPYAIEDFSVIWTIDQRAR